MQQAKILWVDDEIDLLKAPMLFLKEKNFEVESASNGFDALELIKENSYDIIFLDEQMPGMDGLTVLEEIKTLSPNLPVIMITKSEEEHIMEDALGAQISDYLIKPVKPTQILLACKKILDNKRLITQKVNSGYQQDFRNIAMQFMEVNDHEGWADIYRKLIYWEFRMEENEDKSMEEVLRNQLDEANTNFGRFVSRNYLDWLHTKDLDERPMLSPDIFSEVVFPHLDGGYDSVFFILIDCLRYDQWKIFEQIISEFYYIDSEKAYMGILPTATQYARNSIFSGLYPLGISERFSRYWEE